MAASNLKWDLDTFDYTANWRLTGPPSSDNLFEMNLAPELRAKLGAHSNKFYLSTVRGLFPAPCNSGFGMENPNWSSGVDRQGGWKPCPPLAWVDFILTSDGG